MAPPKKHWTQTRKGKALMRQQMKAVWASKREAKTTAAAAHTHSFDFHTAYVFGKTEAFIDFYSSAAGIPRLPLTAGVGELLLRSARRKSVGSAN